MRRPMVMSESSGTNSLEYFDAEEPPEGVMVRGISDEGNGTPETVDSSQRSQSQDPLSKSERRMPAGLEQLRSKRKLVAESQRKDGPVKTKHLVQSCFRFCALPCFIIGAVFGVVYIILYGNTRDGVDFFEFGAFEIQRVLPGRIVALSQSGDFAAVRNDFDFIQIYRRYTIEDESRSSWTPIGQTVKTPGRIVFSKNGTTIAYLDQKSQRPEIRQLEEDNIWRLQDAPSVVGNEISMDETATIMTVALLDRQQGTPSEGPVDILITYRFDGQGWTEYANRIILKGVHTFQLSPTASDLVVTISNSGSNTLVRMYHLTENGDDDPVWDSLASDVTVSEELLSMSLAKTTFALTTSTFTQVYGYSGRTWGQQIESIGNITYFLSSGLSFNGATLALASTNQSNGDLPGGTVNFYRFPYYLDTSDKWEENKDILPLSAAWTLESDPLRDEYGAVAPSFGSALVLDAFAQQILIQSGDVGNENVHFYGLTLE